MAKFIQSDGTESNIEPDNGKKFTLEKLQEVIGGYIEVVAHPSRTETMLADEEGTLKHLPVNPKASMLAGQTIVGNVLLITEGEWE